MLGTTQVRFTSALRNWKQTLMLITKLHQSLLALTICVLLATLVQAQSGTKQKEAAQEEQPALGNVITTKSELSGIGQEKGVMRRDPSDVIKVDDLSTSGIRKERSHPDTTPRFGTPHRRTESNGPSLGWHWTKELPAAGKARVFSLRTFWLPKDGTGYSTLALPEITPKSHSSPIRKLASPSPTHPTVLGNGLQRTLYLSLIHI